MDKCSYNEFIREYFVCRREGESLNTKACNKLIEYFMTFEIPSFYKFMSLNGSYAIKNVKNENLHFSLMNVLNDPFEFQSSIDVTQEQNNREELLKHIVFLEEPTQKEINEFITVKKPQEIMEEIRNYTFVYSMTESYNNAPMWAAYADNYNGICVEYDSREIFKKFNWRLAPVEYVEDIPVLNYEASTNEILKYIHRICTVKNKKWLAENEWRIISIEYYQKLKSLNEKMKPKSIILGNRISEKDKKTLKKISKDNCIPLYEVSFSQKDFKIERRLISSN